VLAAQFLTAIMLAAAMVDGYDFGGAAISDLGTAPGSALLFNAALVVAGVCNVAGGYYFYRLHQRPVLLALFALGGLGAVGAGVFPLDAGDLHGLFALLAFLFVNLQALGSARLLGGPVGLLGAVAGLVGLVFVVVMAVGDAGNAAVFGAIGHGGAERLIVYPVMLWLLVLGGALLAAGPAALGASGRGD
jgi:hypothetical membrane protein